MHADACAPPLLPWRPAHANASPLPVPHPPPPPPPRPIPHARLQAATGSRSLDAVRDFKVAAAVTLLE